MAHELLALQLLTVLLEEPTDDSVEIAVNFTKEIGQVKFTSDHNFSRAADSWFWTKAIGGTASRLWSVE